MSSYDRAEFTSREGTIVRLIDCFSLCTKCGAVKAMSDFGLRTMPDGTIRNQPQCKQCRSGRKQS